MGYRRFSEVIVIFFSVFSVILLHQAEYSWGKTFLTGEALLQICESSTHSDRMNCIGYIVGIQDFLDDLKEFKPPIGLPFMCGPDQLSGDQLRFIVMKYLKENPEKLHFAAGSLVYGAVISAFPCSGR